MRADMAASDDLREARGGNGVAWALVAGAAAALIAAGGLLWWRFGDAVFTDLVMAGLAGCF